MSAFERWCIVTPAAGVTVHPSGLREIEISMFMGSARVEDSTSAETVTDPSVVISAMESVKFTLGIFPVSLLTTT